MIYNFFCMFNNLFGFKINFSISQNKSLTLSSFKIIGKLVVSGKPPLLLMITAEPRLDASKLVLPKGSSHLEQTTDILTFLSKFKI